MAAVLGKLFRKNKKQLIANDEINEKLVREHYARQEKDVSREKALIMFCCHA